MIPKNGFMTAIPGARIKKPTIQFPELPAVQPATTIATLIAAARLRRVDIQSPFHGTKR